jgi:hypothetical protein
VRDARMDRREFLKTLGRLAAFGGLGLIGIKALPGLSGKPAAETCRSDGICPKCAAAGDCGLPQALSFKRETGRS